MTQKAQQDVEKRVSTKQAAFDRQSLRQRIQTALNLMRYDVAFYINHAESLHRWLNTADTPRSSRFFTARKHLMNLKILEKQGKHQFALRSIRRPTRGGDQRLTRYERCQIQWFHGIILADVLYPKCLTATRTKNFVDRRLTQPRPHRDIYQYDPHGNPIGRTRIYDDGRKEQTGELDN